MLSPALAAPQSDAAGFENDVKLLTVTLHQNESERGKRHQKSLFLCFLQQKKKKKDVSIRDWFCGTAKIKEACLNAGKS